MLLALEILTGGGGKCIIFSPIQVGIPTVKIVISSKINIINVFVLIAYEYIFSIEIVFLKLSHKMHLFFLLYNTYNDILYCQMLSNYIYLFNTSCIFHSVVFSNSVKRFLE